MAETGDIEIAVEAAGTDEAIDGIEDTEEALSDAGESMSETSGDMGDMQRRMAGLGKALVASLAVAAGGIVSQVPVVGEAFSGLMAVVDAVTFRMDQVLRPSLSGASTALFDLSNAIFNAEGNISDLVGILGTVGAGAGLLIGALTLIGVTLTGPVLLAIGLVAGAIAALWFAWETNLGGIRDITMGVFDRIRARFNEFVEVVAPIVENAIARLSTFWDNHGETIVGVVSWAFGLIGALIEQVIDTILTVVQFGLQILTGDWEGALETLLGFLQRTADRIVRVFGGLVEMAVEWGKNLLSNFIEGVKDAAGDAGGILGDAVGELTGEVESTINRTVNTTVGGGGGGGGQSGAFSANRGRPIQVVNRMDGRRLTQQDSRYRRDGTASRQRN